MKMQDAKKHFRSNNDLLSEGARRSLKEGKWGFCGENPVLFAPGHGALMFHQDQYGVYMSIPDVIKYHNENVYRIGNIPINI